MSKTAADSTVNAVRGLLDLPNSPCCPERRKNCNFKLSIYFENS